MKKWLALLMIVGGITLIIYPFFKEQQYNKELRELENALSLVANAENNHTELEELEDFKFSKEELSNVMELEIPYIHIKQLVLDRTTDENLNIALTQIKENQQPGEGNFTIAGHRGYRDGRHFSKLEQVPVGENVFLHAKNKVYKYEIVSSEIIEATDIEVLDNQAGKNEITLITCTVSGKQRVAVKGILKEILDRE